MVDQSNLTRLLRSVPFWVIVGVLSSFAVLAVVLLQVTADRGPTEEHDYPIAYRPAMSSKSLTPPQSRLELREGGEASVNNFLIGEIAEDDNGRPCLQPAAQTYSGTASWSLDAKTGSITVKTNAGDAVLLAGNGRIVAFDWSGVTQLVCSSGAAVYVISND